MKLKMRLSALALSFSIATMSFLMVAPQKVNALENEVKPASASVTERVEVADKVTKEGDFDKEKPTKTFTEKELKELIAKSQKERSNISLALMLLFNLGATFISAVFGSVVNAAIFSAFGVLDIMALCSKQKVFMMSEMPIGQLVQ